ncbi:MULTISPECIES: bifunctional phosphopantothenoylcysteine decarboxylase/phosphopantothenate--cysteine ligase CoaBC [Shouchella]|uniref:bifunctional phosphopantothenoylcysteine decarboxylase/phosphopantothenate--cysteine ligase CoaBC n=1 Tax=Shouchella TaxID=2893057 RepID=UPI000922D201|nr:MULTISPECIES: bifunctional phosphopantothenoylcysteine decarboxylase/phosphopantothenate--cysteine ligase CoaBC [Shouchella]MBX0320023.1 bifunctional phosphopantothenoylcysteine decarboxylase/phosphopantothenate--cysteine ligase CoaBC [Shouchella clausii]MCM3380055.1 bifunctional phosphopantothenoylcysteine decarboxylase/phosphopantothenate--cysteine ligase CoaBC [Shouchella rhizosphaerae]SHL14112.1 Phosphopantothenate-cysteine ligase /Phosphopantothenoylcysteine decarboxylase [Shouchella rhi
MLKNKTIVVGVSGGIAAFKTAALVSKLTQAGANVYVVMTEAATKFVTPLTFQALSRNPVYTDTFTEPDATKIAHIDIADQADLVLIAPASANTIAKLAAGIADNMLTTLVLATKAPVALAPAMNVNMYEHPSVQENMEKLRSYHYQLIEPGAGYLACGWVGKGRMAEPEQLLELVDTLLEEATDLRGKQVIVTAGPTREPLDPVRFFSNYSSGKMGYALAQEARRRGAHVTLITGPTALEAPVGVETVAVQTAEEMYNAVNKRYQQADIVIKAAAVADYQPVDVFAHKQKKNADEWSVVLERTKDILRFLGEHKKEQILVGFAAESEQLHTYAKSKLERKNLDLIVANNITTEGAGFDVDTNVVTVFTRDGQETAYPQASKQEVAKQILNELEAYMKRREA